MYIVVMAWLYVALMMAVAESQHPDGGWLGACVTFVLYGLAPLSLVVYLIRTPQRRRAARAREQAEAGAADSDRGCTSLQPDGGGHAARAAVTPVGEPIDVVLDCAPAGRAVVAGNVSQSGPP